jgi:transposase
MEVLHPRCAGLDIHRDTVVACARLVGDGGVEQYVETFGTTTSELERLSRWLAGHGVTHLAMAATGVYWKPVWAVLAADFELVLANAMHIKNVPGRETDVNDAMWLADLLAHGLIRASFVPPVAMQALRDLTRGRKQLMREKASHVQRIDKTLQAANLKLGSVLSDIMGVSGRAIVEALAQRQTDPQVLADCVPIRARLRATRAEVTEALRGRRSDHQRLLLQIHLAQIAALEAAVARIDTEIGERLEPFRPATRQLITIPGVHGPEGPTVRNRTVAYFPQCCGAGFQTAAECSDVRSRHKHSDWKRLPSGMMRAVAEYSGIRPTTAAPPPTPVFPAL